MGKVGSFVNSVVKHAANGFFSVPDEVAHERLSICSLCEHFEKDSVRCKICGCYLNIKTKWASESCPIGKWKVFYSSRERNTIATATELPPIIGDQPCNCGDSHV
jgi:transcription elongation factor Elf1